MKIAYAFYTFLLTFVASDMLVCKPADFVDICFQLDSRQACLGVCFTETLDDFTERLVYAVNFHLRNSTCILQVEKFPELASLSIIGVTFQHSSMLLSQP
jgi:hypothetical protein